MWNSTSICSPRTHCPCGNPSQTQPQLKGEAPVSLKSHSNATRGSLVLGTDRMKNPHSSCSLTSHSYEGAESNEERDSSCPNLWLLRLQISRNDLTFTPVSGSKSKFVAKIPQKESNCVADRYYVYKYKKEIHMRKVQCSCQFCIF